MGNINIKDIHKSYGKSEVLKGININIDDGEFVVMLGPSGCGKSTLLNIVGGIDKSDKGEIIIDGNDILTLKNKDLTLYRRNYLGYIFQQYNLIDNLTVRENIEVGSYISANPLDIDELLEVLGLTPYQNKLPHQLSGGQQQRCAIGRAIIKNPKLLLADEPTGALDYKTSKEILALIMKINKLYNTTIIMVTHNAGIQYLADKIVLLHDGNIKDVYLNTQKKTIDEVEW